MARPNNAGAIGQHVRGLREAKAAFQALPPITRDAMNDATELTLREIVRQAKTTLQSNPSVRTRNLLNAVGWTLNRKSGRGRAGIQNVTTTLNVGGRRLRVRGIVRAGEGGSALTSRGARLDRPARRAHFVEFGTKRMTAEPFMMPAAESQRGPFLDRAKRAGKQIERGVAAIGTRTF